MFDNDYIHETNANYWAEENEMKLGIHPTQIRERIKERLSCDGVEFNDITFLDWAIGGSRVRVWLDKKEYGTFNYETNKFESWKVS